MPAERPRSTGRTVYTSFMRSSIFKNEAAVRSAVANNSTMKDTIIALGLRPAGGNYKSLINSCEKFGITVPRASGKLKTQKAREYSRKSNEEVFTVNSKYSNRNLIKKRLYKLGIPEECSECGLTTIWNGKPITLQLDHINGIHNDNRIENLRIVCPNCHSQTDTFCGRNFNS